MRLISRRAQAEQAAKVARLRDRIADLEAEVLEQGRANGRLARSAAIAEGSIAGARAAVAGPYRELKARFAQQEELTAALRRENARLERRLDDALGRTPADKAAIDSGSGEPRRAATQ